MPRGGGYNAIGGDDGHMMYDDSVFELYAVSFLACLWVPVLLYKILRVVGRAFAAPVPALVKARDEWCACSLCQKRRKDVEAANRPRFGMSAGNLAFIVVGLMLAVGCVRVYRANVNAEPPFDPFAILGVSGNATPREIKKAYRVQAVKLHPDKNPGNPDAVAAFVKLTKAHAALTDEDAKENYRKYGNPDGYIGTTLGVGLPSFVENNNTAMLLVYLGLLAIFPFIVFIWWRRQSQLLPTSVTTDTFLLYRETISQTQRFRDLLGCLSGSFEYESLFKSENAEHIPDMTKALLRAAKDDFRRVKCVTEPKPFQVQNLVVLNMYLSRLPIPPALQYVLDGIMSRVEPLLTALTDTVGAFQRPDCQHAWEGTYMHGHTTFLQTCINVSQCIIQGVDKTDSPLLQIPGFTAQEVKYCNGSRTNPARTVYEFIRLEPSVQRSLLRSFSDDQFADVKAFCERYPVAMLSVSDPKVEDEEDQTVHTRDMVTIRAKLTVMRKAGSVYSPHTPNLAHKKAEVWWVSLADHRLMCPIEVKRLLPKDAVGHDPELRRPTGGDSCCGGVSGGNDSEADKLHASNPSAVELVKDPRVTVYDLKFEFAAPRSGSYNLELVAAVDCYVGCNKSKTIKMDVLPAIEVDTSGHAPYFGESGSESDDSASSGEELGAGTATDSDYEYVEVEYSDSDAEVEGEVKDTLAVEADEGDTDFSDDESEAPLHSGNGMGNGQVSDISRRNKAMANGGGEHGNGNGNGQMRRRRR